MSATPNKDSAMSTFIPKELYTPNKEMPGISKTVFMHVSTLQGLLDDWSKARDSGTKLCRTVVALKLYECTDDYYPSQLKSLMDSLVQCLDALRDIVQGIETLSPQLRALAGLQKTDCAVINTWSMRQVTDQVDSILSDLRTELRLKEAITENIAHCREEGLIEVYASSWELDVFHNGAAASCLRAEVGLHSTTK